MKIRYLAFALCGCIGTIHADIVFTLGNNPQPGEVNILLNSGGTGTTVMGTPSGLPMFLVDFTSTQTLLEPSSGQARVSGNPEGTPLKDITISLENGATYGDLIINPFIGGCGGCVFGTGTVTVNAVDNMGVAEAPAVFSYPIDNGNNFLTITTLGGERIVSTSVVDTGSFNDLRQPRISELAAAVPEPTYAPLLALALGSIALLRRSRKV
jgi:hypothetical protein